MFVYYFWQGCLISVLSGFPEFSTARPGRNHELDQSVLDSIIRRIVDVAQPERVILFGSAARDGMGPDSDIDLLVVKLGVPHWRRLAQQIHLALFGIGVPVDIIVVTPGDIEALRDNIGSIIGPAVREGKDIYVA